MSEPRWEAGGRIPFTANKGLTSEGAGDAAELQSRLGAKDQERSLCWLVLNTQIDEWKDKTVLSQSGCVPKFTYWKQSIPREHWKTGSSKKCVL